MPKLSPVLIATGIVLTAISLLPQFTPVATAQSELIYQSERAVPRPPIDPYPTEVVTNFVNACTESSGGQTTACTCSIQRIQAEYTLAEFARIEKYMADGLQPPPKFVEIIQDCVNIQ
jgi:NaMN:DMB phosphoribosyltransferase